MTDRQGVNKLFNLDVKPGSPLIIIFSESESPRLLYTCRFIFNHVFNISFEIISDKAKFKSSSLPKINYSKQSIDKCITIHPGGLLDEKNVNNIFPSLTSINDQFILFPTCGALGFDIFSAVFYMISRYEEWLPFNKDQHQRFELNESILYKNQLHLKPVVDIWIEQLKTTLSEFYSQINFPQREFKIISTIDVDNLYAYNDKGSLRTLGAIGKDIVKGNLKNLKRRIAVLSGQKKDPFDIYESFSAFCDKNGIPLIYFFLFKTGTKYDRTVNPVSSAFNRVFGVIKANKAWFGLHPSYGSSDDQALMQSQINSFSKKSGRKTVFSRQHYLRFNIKTTPQLLIDNGIIADFTMGFASGPGFRAGTTHPFYYYDFSSEKETELLMVPFCAMDGAYSVYKKTSADEAFQSLNALKKEVKKLNGNFITVFHERTFDEELYPQYGSMYKRLLST